MATRRLEPSASAQAFGPRLLGVPVPARAFGFSPGWCRATIEAFEPEAGAASDSIQWMSESDGAYDATANDLALVRQWKRIGRQTHNFTSEVAAA